MAVYLDENDPLKMYLLINVFADNCEETWNDLKTNHVQATTIITIIIIIIFNVTIVKQA